MPNAAELARYLALQDSAVAREVKDATAAVAQRRRSEWQAAAAAAGHPPLLLPAEASGGGKKGKKSGSKSKGGKAEAYQNDPQALEKLLLEPGGGYKEPKGGFVRWAEGTILKSNSGADRGKQGKGAAAGALSEQAAMQPLQPLQPPRASTSRAQTLGAFTLHDSAFVGSDEGRVEGRDDARAHGHAGGHGAGDAAGDGAGVGYHGEGVQTLQTVHGAVSAPRACPTLSRTLRYWLASCACVTSGGAGGRCMRVPSPTLSPTDPVPRGQLGAQGQ